MLRTCRAAACAFAASFFFVGTAAGASGTVREVSGGTAVVETRGGGAAVGDKAEIYFTLAGTDDEISVGSGTVVSVDGSTARVKIDSATGDVAKDHLVRFIAGGRQGGAAVEPTPPAKPLPTPTRTLPPSVPSPTVTAKKAATGGEAELDPAAMELIRKGAAQHAAGDLDAAIASYTSAIRIAPRFGVAYLNRANAYLYKPKFQAAITDANKAIELTVPKMADAYNVRGTAKAGLGDYDGALADCNRVLKLEPNNALAYNNRANNKLRKADYRGALADCNKSISLDPNSALPYYNRGYVRTNLGDQPGALADWMKAVALQPSFGAELNPKIAQLQAMGITARQGSSSSNASAKSASEGEWTDLVNPRQKLIGKWQGGRHVTQYFADGTFVTDPDLVPDAPKGRWQVQGDRLIENFPQAGITTTHNILSIDSKTLVIRNERGETFKKTRISR